MKKHPYDNMLQIMDLPDNLKQQFKSACAAGRISMKDAVVDFMKEFIREKRNANKKEISP